MTATVDAIRQLARKKWLGVKHHYNIWREKSFDRRFGISTFGIDVDVAALGATGEHVAQSAGYEPIQLPVFKAIMRAVRIDPRQYLFIDFGSGKGRALVLAARYGFKRVIGVEFAPSLHEIAARNVEIYRSRNKRSPPVDLHCADAAHFAIPDGDAMLFFYNPFGFEVLSKICRNIEAAFRSRPRTLIIAYRNPVHANVFDSADFLTRQALNDAFAIYRSPVTSLHST